MTKHAEFVPCAVKDHQVRLALSKRFRHAASRPGLLAREAVSPLLSLLLGLREATSGEVPDQRELVAGELA